MWVKIDDVNEDDGKYGVDMRFVHQLDGQGLKRERERLPTCTANAVYINPGKDLDPFQAKPVHRLPDNGFVPVKRKEAVEVDCWWTLGGLWAPGQLAHLGGVQQTPPNNID